MAEIWSVVVSVPGRERVARTPFRAPVIIHATAEETGGALGMSETFTPPGQASLSQDRARARCPGGAIQARHPIRPTGPGSCVREQHHVMTAFLRTERLLLRPRIPADAEQIHPIVSEWDVVCWTWPWPADLAFTEERMCRVQPEQGLLASILLEGSVIGLASLSDATLGFLIAPEAWGRGYATEACATLIAYGFDTTGWPKITAAVHTGNLGSLRVLDKLGFRVTGESIG